MLTLTLLACAAHRGTPEVAERAVVLVSLDGFRADYLERYAAPNLLALAERGVRADAMVPSFPTKTFPNHYTVITGLYPEHHGIVANRFYDPGFDATFSLRDRKDAHQPRWWGGEPFWATCERQGVTAGTYFWPGSEVPIEGRATYWRPYDAEVGNPERVDTVLSWLSGPRRQRARFATLYFSPVDTRGHAYGPDSEEVGEAVAYVDRLIGRLLDGLEERGLSNTTDVLVVSDHGMAAVAPDRFVDLEALLDPVETQMRTAGSSPLVLAWPDPDRVEATRDALDASPHLRAWTRDQVPERLHFQDSDRVPPVLAVADLGWSVGDHGTLEKLQRAEVRGAHGYDNAHPEMHGIFLGAGPGLQEGLTIEAFDNIHVYELLAALMQIEPAPNDGDRAELAEALR